MTVFKERLRRAVRRTGFDIKRYPQSDPMWGLTRFLETRGIALIIDVGANDGGYGRSLRQHGYSGRILSFEPAPDSYARLHATAGTDPQWDLLPLALGDSEGTVVLNIAGNDGASSSVLPMLNRHRAAAPDSAYVGSAAVKQCRLDDVLATQDSLPQNVPMHLKIDVQGYERHVLDGATTLLANPNLLSLQLELSLVSLYEGGMLWSEGLEIAQELGMRPAKFMPGFTDPVSGEGLQFDGVFVRDDTADRRTAG